jgi:hypothetical protein
MRRPLALAAALPLSLALLTPARAGDCKRDRSGMNWVLPFKNALETAKSEKRLLLIKPIAFGTTPDGGW